MDRVSWDTEKNIYMISYKPNYINTPILQKNHYYVADWKLTSFRKDEKKIGRKLAVSDSNLLRVAEHKLELTVVAKKAFSKLLNTHF